MFRTEIPSATPSLNQIKRMHYHAYGRLRDRYTVLLRLAMMQPALAHGFRHVTITRFSTRALDHDNFVGGCKPLVDAMKRVGLIVDDSPTHVSIIYNQRKSTRKAARTLVEIIP